MRRSGPMAEPTLLEATGLRLSLPDFSRKPPFGPAPVVDILRGIDLALAPGDTLGIVGESGSGKSSLGRTLVRLHAPTAGRLRFDGRDITHLPEERLRPLRAQFQMIFQDPQSSLNPRHRVADIVAQPLRLHRRARTRTEARKQVDALLERVALRPAHGARYPHELSGGERQRVGIARAVALRPRLVVADEIVSGLDVSSQAQILALLRELRLDLDLALLFISHDLSVVRTVCDRVMVMLNGRAVEQGDCAAIFAAPRHPYTRRLLNAIPLPEVDPDWVARAAENELGETLTMNVKDSVALVTGANRGVGAAFVRALLDRGAAKVYAAMRGTDGYEAPDGRVQPIAVDVTDHDRIARAAAECGDVNLLVNNAGVNHNQPISAGAAQENARDEMDVNFFGTMEMCRQFAPVLGGNGGGAIVNMLSILSRVNLPMIGTYCASKAATLSLTQGVRAELAAQGTLVVAVMPAAIDTRMGNMNPPPLEDPIDVANAALDAVEAGEEDIYPGVVAGGVSQGLAADPKGVEKQFAEYLPG